MRTFSNLTERRDCLITIQHYNTKHCSGMNIPQIQYKQSARPIERLGGYREAKIEDDGAKGDSGMLGLLHYDCQCSCQGVWYNHTWSGNRKIGGNAGVF
jgi:hypothetical protein